MGEGCDSLHLDRVALIQRMVEDTWSVDNLPTRIFVIGMSHKQVLSGEGIRLNINISIRNIIDEARLSDIGEASDDECASVGVNCGQSAQMLPDFLKVAQRRLKLLEEGARATEGCSLELLGSVERVGVLEKTNVVVGNAVHDRLCLVAMAQGKLVMVTIVEHVHQVSVEGVDIVELGKAIDDARKFLVDGLLHELYFAHVELANALNLEALAHLSGRLALSL